MPNSCILSSNPERLSVMKKFYIAIAVLAAAMLISCEREKSFNDVTIGENDVVLSLQGAPATRAADMGLVQKGVTISFESTGDGNKLFLEETVEDLNSAWAPATKGTPVYTENVGVLYKNKLGVYAAGNFGDATYESMDTEMYPRKGGEYGTGNGWRYHHNYDGDPWPNETTAVDFYFRMPVDMDEHGVTLGESAYSNGTISFSYTSPTKASDQQDIIFAARPISKAEYKGALPNGVPVLFNHALTGVKFAIANYDDEAQISIKSVSFSGLIGTGSCTVTPSSETNHTDVKDNHSSTVDGVVVWRDTRVVENAVYSSGEFGTPVSYESGSFANNGNYPDSFKGAGAAMTANLNDADATQTFWFIPQAMKDGIELTIKYTYGSSEVRTGVIDFGKELAKSNVVWKAGQLRTYTIRVDEVNVKIEDTVTLQGSESDSYKNSIKNAVVISNTGNTDVYIRAAIVGQWLDENGDPVFGFTDYTAGKVKLVESWYQDQFGENGKKTHGTFSGLVGYDIATSDWWKKGDDGYYYFKYVVPADKAVPDATAKYLHVVSSTATPSEKTGAAPLFTSYTLGEAPAVTVAGKKKKIYFELEIVSQAISAKKSDGSYYSMSDAWKEAGVTVTE